MPAPRHGQCCQRHANESSANVIDENAEENDGQVPVAARVPFVDVPSKWLTARVGVRQAAWGFARVAGRKPLSRLGLSRLANRARGGAGRALVREQHHRVWRVPLCSYLRCQCRPSHRVVGLRQGRQAGAALGLVDPDVVVVHAGVLFVQDAAMDSSGLPAGAGHVFGVCVSCRLARSPPLCVLLVFCSRDLDDALLWWHDRRRPLGTPHSPLQGEWSAAALLSALRRHAEHRPTQLLTRSVPVGARLIDDAV